MIIQDNSCDQAALAAYATNPIAASPTNGRRYSRARTFLPLILVVAAVLFLLTGCSKVVKWDEEVLLNTGQTITVKRTEQYTVQGNAGNPFDMAYLPKGNTRNEFVWAGKSYVFEGHGGTVLLAISPRGLPVFVAPADSGRWDATHGYKCTLPFYVEFIPDASGKAWTWLESIEPWLYNLPTNLLRERRPPGEMKTRYTPADVANQRFMSDPQIVSIQKIDPSYTGDLCKSKLKGE